MEQSDQEVILIPFDEMQQRLENVRKDRNWLAAQTYRSPHSIRTALAPGAPASKRSQKLQHLLSRVILAAEREAAEERRKKMEKEQTPAPSPPVEDRIVLEVSPEQYEAYNGAALKQGKPIKNWAIACLNDAARKHLKISEFPSAKVADSTDGSKHRKNNVKYSRKKRTGFINPKTFAPPVSGKTSHG